MRTGKREKRSPGLAIPRRDDSNFSRDLRDSLKNKLLALQGLVAERRAQGFKALAGLASHFPPGGRNALAGITGQALAAAVDMPRFLGVVRHHAGRAGVAEHLRLTWKSDVLRNATGELLGLPEGRRAAAWPTFLGVLEFRDMPVPEWLRAYDDRPLQVIARMAAGASEELGSLIPAEDDRGGYVAPLRGGFTRLAGTSGDAGAVEPGPHFLAGPRRSLSAEGGGQDTPLAASGGAEAPDMHAFDHAGGGPEYR